VVHGLRAVGRLQLDRLPRMADFALWATACETSLWPAGTFSRAYAANRKAAIEDLIDADPIAACVRELMSERSSWTGTAADLLRVNVERSSLTGDDTRWPQNPRALAGRLRRAQTFLRALSIHITFTREGRAGSRVSKYPPAEPGALGLEPLKAACPCRPASSRLPLCGMPHHVY